MKCVLFFFSSLFFAEIDISNLLAADDEGSSYFGQFMTMIFTLALVLGLILVTLWFLKKMVASRSRHLNKSTIIQILERRSLSHKSSLYLVKVEDKKILISDSPTGVSLICECTAKEEEDFLSEEEDNKNSFSAVLSNKLKGIFVKNA